MPENKLPLLERLKSEIQYDKLTVSFSIEGRDQNGVKKFCQFSATASRNKTDGLGWSPSEMPIIKGLMSKQVVALTYKDAAMRGVLTRPTANGELKSILEDIDKDIQKRTGDIE